MFWSLFKTTFFFFYIILLSLSQIGIDVLLINNRPSIKTALGWFLGQSEWIKQSLFTSMYIRTDVISAQALSKLSWWQMLVNVQLLTKFILYWTSTEQAKLTANACKHDKLNWFYVISAWALNKLIWLQPLINIINCILQQQAFVYFRQSE